MKLLSRIALLSLVSLGFAEFNSGDFLLSAGAGYSLAPIDITYSYSNSNIVSLLLNSEAKYFINNRFFLQADASYNSSSSGTIFNLVRIDRNPITMSQIFKLNLNVDTASSGISTNYIWTDSFSFLKNNYPIYKGYLGIGLNYVSFSNGYYTITDNSLETKIDANISSKTAFSINSGSIYNLSEKANIELSSKIIFMNSTISTNDLDNIDGYIPLIIKSTINFTYKF